MCLHLLTDERVRDPADGPFVAHQQQPVRARA
jgi:hypothetical protein